MVYISDANLMEKSDGAEEIKTIKHDNLTAYINIKFTEIDDYVKYKINIKNESNKDYIISNKNITNISDYMTYELTFDDDSDIVKAGENKIVYLTVSYKNELSDEQLEDGYSESKNFAINLLNKDETEVIENPKTGIESAIPMLIIEVFGVIAFVILKKHTRSKILILVLLVSLLPLATYALDTLTIDVSSNVEIEETVKEFCYYDYGIDEDGKTDSAVLYFFNPTVAYYYPVIYVKYRSGMTWEKFLDSKYNQIDSDTTIGIEAINGSATINVSSRFSSEIPYLFAYYENYVTYPDQSMFYIPGGFTYNNDEEIFYSKNADTLKSKIIDSSQGCYNPKIKDNFDNDN